MYKRFRRFKRRLDSVCGMGEAKFDILMCHWACEPTGVDMRAFLFGGESDEDPPRSLS